MRLNFTGRRKLQKQHVKLVIADDPPGSQRGYYFDLHIDFSNYKLPPEARVFVEASRKLTLMRFDLGTVGEPARLTSAERRLTEFSPSPDRVRFRVKVVQPDGPDAGKLLAEADGIAPHEGDGVLPLIRVAGDDEMAETPWRLDLVPTDAELPTLAINTRIGGRSLADDPIAGPLLMTAAVREVFTLLVREADIESEDEDHWATLWMRYAREVLGMNDPNAIAMDDDAALREWVDEAVSRFTSAHQLATKLESHMLQLEQQDVEEIN